MTPGDELDALSITGEWEVEDGSALVGADGVCNTVPTVEGVGNAVDELAPVKGLWLQEIGFRVTGSVTTENMVPHTLD